MENENTPRGREAVRGAMSVSDGNGSSEDDAGGLATWRTTVDRPLRRSGALIQSKPHVAGVNQDDKQHTAEDDC